MDWKVVVLLAILLPNNMLSLPLEFCCQQLANSISSPSFNLQIQRAKLADSITADDGDQDLTAEEDVYISPSSSSATISSTEEEPSRKQQQQQQLAELGEESSSSCCNDIQQLVAAELTNEQEEKLKRSSSNSSNSTIAVPTSSSNNSSSSSSSSNIGPRRAKRFPIHLDPLYQYRYLARSGRKFIPFIPFIFFHFFTSVGN